MDLGPGLAAEGDQIVDLDDQLAEMIALRDEGKIGAIGISSVPLDDVAARVAGGDRLRAERLQPARPLAGRDARRCAASRKASPGCRSSRSGSSFPAFPKVADNAVVREIAGELGATPAQVGLAWLLAHAPNTLLIPGTRSIAHLEENVGAAGVVLSADALERLDAVRPEAKPRAHGVEAFRTGNVAGMGSANAAPEPPWWLKPANKVFIQMSRLGMSFGGESPVVLTVPGRKSGTPRSTPVTPMTVDGKRYVVGGFPGADWVQNVRAAGEVTLRRGRTTERVRMVELSPEEARPLLRAFPTEVPTGVGFMKRSGLVSEGRPEEFEALAGRCAVFRFDPV